MLNSTSVIRANRGMAPSATQKVTVLGGRCVASMALYGIHKRFIRVARSGQIRAPVVHRLVQIHWWRIEFRCLLRAMLMCVLPRCRNRAWRIIWTMFGHREKGGGASGSGPSARTVGVSCSVPRALALGSGSSFPALAGDELCAVLGALGTGSAACGGRLRT